MKLEYLYNISENGKYGCAVKDELVRLFNFKNTETPIEFLISQGRGGW